MRLYLLLAVISMCGASKVCSPHEHPPTNSGLPVYVINLDLPPQQRWTQLTKDKMKQTSWLIKDLKRLLGESVVSLLDRFLPMLTKTLPSPFKEEIEGISKVSGIPLGEVTLYNIFYEVFSFCTSVVAQGKNGRMFHARNLDFGLFLGWDIKNHTWQVSEHLRPLVVELDFQRNKKTVFRSVSFAGYVGVLTAMKPETFGLTVDERFRPNGGYEGILEWIMGNRKQQWMGFLTREIMENTTSYLDAYKILSSREMLSPVYFILSGTKPGQGCIITRGHKDKDVWCLGEKSPFQNGTWYVLETNYDHWKKPPFFDNRRDPAIHCMEAVGPDNISLDKIYQVLSTKPVLNKLTVYTTLMETATGKMKSWLRTCPDPCPLW